MLSVHSQVCFAALLAVLCHAQALDRSNQNTTLANHGFGNETRCSWNCTVNEMDEIKTTIARGKLIELVVKYENKVDDRCVNETSRNSSRNATEHWQIWLQSKQLSTFAKVMESLENMMFDTDSNKEHKEFKALCTLRPSGTTATASEYNSGQFPMFSRGHLAALGVELNTTVNCHTEKTENLQPCINITNSTENSSTNSTSPFERGGWPVAVLYGFCIVFLTVFVHYSPAFLCLFLPTEVTEDGARHIILEGVSPVSFQSLIGNYFFSEDDGTIWHKVRTFIFRVVIMPLPFLVIAICADSHVNLLSFLKNNFFVLLMVCCVCYIIKAFYISFFTMMLVQAKPCSVCKHVRPKIFSCQDELPLLIINHLRLQPLILVKCWQLFIHCMLRYLKLTLILFPSSEFSFLNLLRFPLIIVFLSTVPPVTMILSILTLLLAFNGIVLSSPIVKLCNARFSAINAPCIIVWIMRYYVTVLGAVGLSLVIASAGLGTLHLLLSGFELLFSEESLPYVACFVLVLYYVWSSYSSVTNSYQDLAFALFKYYKKSRHDRFVAMAVSTDQVRLNITADFEDDEMKIPKRLFHMACEELKPIREGVCKMILKITIIASFVLLAFSFIMLKSDDSTPFMKAILTFLTGSFPKITTIYIDGGRQKGIEAMIADEKIPKIVREYIRRTSGTSGLNNRQENCDADTEMILFNENEESTALINV